MTPEQQAEQAGYLRGIEDAAKVADMWETENFRLSTDTTVFDPIIGWERYRLPSGGIAVSERLTLEGHGYASRAHAARDVAAAIRALGHTAGRV